MKSVGIFLIVIMVGTWAMLRILRSVKVVSADIIIGFTFLSVHDYKMLSSINSLRANLTATDPF